MGITPDVHAVREHFGQGLGLVVKGRVEAGGDKDFRGGWGTLGEECREFGGQCFRSEAEVCAACGLGRTCGTLCRSSERGLLPAAAGIFVFILFLTLIFIFTVVRFEHTVD